jgi:hypothetical protein
VNAVRGSALSFEYHKPEITVADPQTFDAVRSVIESAFSAARVKDFLKSIARAGLRVRDFELVLGKGLLGVAASDEYSKLGNADQGQVREFYLASLEKVDPDVRQKFFKLYAYY